MGRSVEGSRGAGGGRKTPEKQGGTKAGGRLREFIPPDGGYGWVIVVAIGLTNFCIVPIIQNFGLVYKDSLKRWNISTVEYSAIMNLQFSICSCVGLITGPLLKAYGYRRITFAGAVLVSLSSVLTSQVNKFYLFLITYSLLGGVGVGFVFISTSLAINTYFKERRGVATGIAWAATGLSPVVFPHFLTWLRGRYDVHGTVLIASGIMLHSIPAAMLLHPVERHAKFKAVKDAGEPSAEDADESMKLVDSPSPKRRGGQAIGMPEVSGSRRSSVQLHRKRHSLPHAAAQGAPGDILADTQATLGLEIATPISLHASRVSLDNAGGTNLRRTAAHSDFAEALAVAKCELDGVEEEGRPQAASPEGRGSGTRGGAAAARFRAWMRRVADYFDLYLLCDFRFLMVFIGLTLAYVGEINFSLFASFVFLDKGFGLEKAATMMSTLASVDLVTRFTMPIFSDHFKLDSIFMYSIGLTLLATGRIMLAHLSSYTGILCATLWLGLGKGFRTVYMALVIPSIVPLEKLPSASGLQTLASGILFFTIGPLFGYIRDNSDSYLPALYTINVFTFGAILVWILEAVCTRSRKRREAEKKKKKNKTNCVNTIVIVK